jgi:hypothetical protein
MMDRRGWALCVFLLVVGLSGLTFTQVHATGASKTITAKLLRADPTHGWIAVPTITATSIYHDTGLFYFTGLDTVTVGFDPGAGTNMTALTVSNKLVVLTLSHAGTIRVYSGWGGPTSVTGAALWLFDGVMTTTVTMTAAGSITLNWHPSGTGGYVDPSLVTGPTTTGYLTSGDYIGLIFAPYTLLLGDMFGGIILFAIMMPLYNRTQSLDYCLVVWVLLSATLTVALPLTAFRLAYVMLILGIAALLYRMLIPRG